MQQEQFSTFLNTALNDKQRQAVQQKSGIFLVCAGAGSGKTRVITARITNLMLNEEVHAHGIVALTFTNKAAREMKERVAHFMPGMRLPFVGTFHAYCLQVLKMYRSVTGLPEFTILDDEDQEKLVRGLIARYGLQKSITVKSIMSTISQMKNSLYGMQADPIMQQMYDAYEREKKVSNAFDFDDLLLEVLRLFRTQPPFKQQFQERVRHLLVDEYQDTNEVQHALLKEMTLRSDGSFAPESLCVVGDEDQSIYSWRGATIANIIHFKKDFRDTQTITIDQNYRSVQSILDIANAVIQNNMQRNEKKLWSERKGLDRVRILSCASGYQEADVIAHLAQIHSRVKKTHSIAVLYRSHYQSRTIEEILIRASVPYRIIGGIRFYNRQEIKDLLAYLKLMVNPYDRVSFTRVINVPSRGLGDKFVELFMEQWDAQPLLDVYSLANYLIQEKIIAKSRQESVYECMHILKECSALISPDKILDMLIIKTGYLTYLKESFDTEEARTKIENVKELMRAVESRVAQEPHLTLSDFLHEIALLQEQSENIDESLHTISLMTLHAAKGLEFDTVILAGVEEGILPSGHALYDASTLEEERRLLYVGITRARERLVVTHARLRTVFGQMNDQRPSRFIQEIPKTIPIIDITRWGRDQLRQYLSTWYN